MDIQEAIESWPANVPSITAAESSDILKQDFKIERTYAYKRFLETDIKTN